MRTIGIFPNSSKQNVDAVLNNIIETLKDEEIKILIPEKSAQELGYNEYSASREEIIRQIDLAITIGGDGTLLSTARKIAEAGIPICGINMGRLGFLAEVEVSELSTKLAKILRGDYEVEDRLMLDAVIKRDNTTKEISAALNDVVITKGGFSRMLRLKLFIDGIFTANYQADGLIIATSTGSTGYSLSAGGPIINPNLKVVLITPICPHTLNARSLIISSEEEVRINTVETQTDIVLTIDGQIVHELVPGDEVIIKRTPYAAKFIKFEDKSYYETLRTKLWRGE